MLNTLGKNGGGVFFNVAKKTPLALKMVTTIKISINRKSGRYFLFCVESTIVFLNTKRKAKATAIINATKAKVRRLGICPIV